LDDVSVEVISDVNKEVLASVVDFEGPIARWCRELEILLGAFSDWVERGPLAPEQLGAGADAALRLSCCGIHQIQVEILEVVDVQSLLADLMIDKDERRIFGSEGLVRVDLIVHRILLYVFG